ncbi:family 16 glycoside hydrolase [Cohnella sp. GCM10020058]|uniref:family 16 glycoside hydrolase n=1 Tax=Cohnella sp. GCM10020058 TaxID=3317330 RepID=UPI00363B1DB8
MKSFFKIGMCALLAWGTIGFGPSSSRPVYAASVIKNGNLETGGLTGPGNGWTVHTTSGAAPTTPANLAAVDSNKQGDYFLATGVMKDRWTISGGKLNLNRQSEEGDMFVQRLNAAASADMELSAVINIADGGATAGLKFRADDRNMKAYGLLLYPGSDELALVKFPYMGEGNLLHTQPYTLNTGTDYTVKVQSYSQGGNVVIKVYIGGTNVFNYTDVNQPSQPFYFQPNGVYAGVTANTTKATFDDLTLNNFAGGAFVSNVYTDNFSSSSLASNYKLFPGNQTIIDDSFVGMIVSDSFTVDNHYITFRMAGQEDAANEYVALVRDSDNVMLYKETGENNDYMSVKAWDVSAYQGQTVHIAIVDNGSGGRAHMVADDFRLASAVPMEKDVSILESQVGYHTDGVKRIYLRSAKANPDVDPAGRTFQIKSGGTTLGSGTVSSRQEKWGSYWWVLDFSAYTTAGTNLHVQLDDLVSSDFDIGDHVMTDNNQLITIALDQLEARAVPGKEGWLDSSGDIRELTSMIIATNALVDIYENFNAQLSPANQTRLHNLIADGADYLAAAQQPDGRFVHDLYPNPWGGYEVLTLHDAIYAMTALARAYQVTSNGVYLNAAGAAYDMIQARKGSPGGYNPLDEIDYHGDGNGLTYTSRGARIEYYIPDASWTMPTSMKTKEKMTYLWANTLMFKLTGDPDYKNTAIELADSVAERQFTDFNNPVGPAYGNFYEFEGYDNAFVKDWIQAYGILLGYIEPTNLKGFMDLIELDPGHANVAKWYNVVRTYGENYIKKTAADNPLGIYPVAAYADPAYRDVKYFQSIAHGATSLYGMIAKNILEIGNFLGDAAYQKLAENNLQFVVGLNPGIPNSPKETAWDSRSLLKNIGERSFQGFGGLSEAPDGSGYNGFSAVDQFVQKDVRLSPDAPKGILRPNGLLQFNEDYIPHGLGYAGGLAFLEGPFKLKITAKNNGSPVSASVNVQLAAPHSASTGPGGEVTVTNLPLGQSGTVSVTYGSSTIERPIAVVGGGRLEWSVDFADYVGVTVAVPAALTTGHAKQGTVTLHNYGSGSVTGTLSLLADGATLSSGSGSVTIGAGSTATQTFDVVPGSKTMPYLVHARFVSAHNDSTANGYGSVQGSTSQLLADDFSTGDLAGWERTFSGTWSTASGKGQVGTSGANDAYALYRGPRAQSFTYEGDLSIASQSGTPRGAAGLTFWSNDDGTKRYDLVVDKGDSTIKIIKRPYSIVDYRPVAGGFAYGQTYHVKLAVQGTSAAVYLDNMSTPVFTTTLPDFFPGDSDNPCSACDRFGIFGYDNGAVAFDNLSATLLRPVTGVSLNKSSLTLTPGFKETLRANFAPANAANRTVTWSSSDPSIASVSANGVVSGVREGTAVVTAATADGSYTASAAVDVKLVSEDFSTDAYFMNTWSIYAGAWYDIPANGSVEVASPKGFAYSVNNMAEAADFAYSAKIKLKSGASAGLSFRLDDAGTQGYDVSIDTGGNIQLAARPYGGAIGTASYTYSASKTYALKVVAEQSRIKVYLDGVEKISAATNHQYSRGRFGLMAFQSTAEFDDVEATAILLNDNFDDNSLDGWTASGAWTNASHKLQFNTGAGNTAILTNGAASANNFIYEGDVTLASGDVGLSFRLNGAATQGYDLILSQGGGVVKLAERPYVLLASASYALNANQTYRVKVVASGEHIQAYVDGTKVIDSYGASTYKEGKFGLLAYSSTGTVDNLKASFLAPAGSYSDSFNASSMTGWRAVGGTWSNSSNYRQGSATTAGGEQIYEDVVGDNMTVSADLTIHSGTAAGLGFRLNDYSTGGYTVILDRLDSGGILKLATKPYAVLGAYYLPVATDTAYNVKVEAVGPRIKVYLNNVLRIDVTDKQYSRGKMGLFAYDSTSYFDNLNYAKIGS